VDSVAPLRDSRFRWLFVGRTVSMFGSSTVTIALVFAVLDISSSPGALGAVLAAHTTPMAAFMLFGGVVADRFPRGRVLQIPYVASTRSGRSWRSPSASSSPGRWPPCSVPGRLWSPRAC